MARRRGRKRGSRKKNRAVPVLPVLPVLYVGYDAFKSYGMSTTALSHISTSMTGYSPEAGTFNVEKAMPFWLGEGAAIIVHKIASRTGVNKFVRKMTMGYLEL